MQNFYNLKCNSTEYLSLIELQLDQQGCVNTNKDKKSTVMANAWVFLPLSVMLFIYR